MKQVIQLDKRTGIKYVYEYECYWDKDKKQSRYSKRKLVGHIDSITGEVVPNRPTKPSPANPSVRRMFTGIDHLLGQMGSDIGLDEDLRLAFGQSFDAILSVAQFLISEDTSAISRFARWSRSHVHPLGHELTSQRASELFASIRQKDLETFFKARIERSGDEYWLYDTTSISSYSEYIEDVRWGKNKDRVPLKQLKLAVITDGASGLPVSFKEIAGNISDVTLIRSLLREQRVLGAGVVKLCLDRGFYSKANIDTLMDEHMKFLIGLKTSLSYVSSLIEKNSHELRGWRNYYEESGVFGMRLGLDWAHEHKDKWSGEIKKVNKRAYLYLYYSPARVAKDEQDLARSLQILLAELESGNRSEDHEKLYERYFKKVRGEWVGRTDVIEKERQHFGYFALLSNDSSLSAKEALSIYKNKDQIEDGFYDVKNRLDFRKPKVENIETLRGKLLCVFVGLILTHELRRRMRQANLFSIYTVNGVIDELESIERYEAQGHRPKVLVVTDKQKKLYEALGVAPLTTS